MEGTSVLIARAELTGSAGPIAPHEFPASLEASAGPRVWMRMANVALALIASLALAAGSLYLFTRNNDFPLSYHPDEDGKVEQILSPAGERNFRHPLLMIESAELLWQRAGKPQDPRDVAIVGRSASALLASVAVLAVALAAFAARGWIGLAVVGPTVALCPPLLVYAHYLKEDASLIGGLGLATLGAVLVVSTRRARAQLPATIVLAVGCAAAASGKYVGAAACVPALLAVFVAPLARWWQWPLRVVLFALVAVAAAVAINVRAFEDPWHLKLKPVANESFEWEYDHGTTGHSGVTLAKPNAFCLRVAASETMPHVWTIAVLGSVAIAARAGVAMRASWRRRRAASTRPTWTGTSVPLRPASFRRGIVLVAFPATFAVVLAYNAIPFERYALPITFFAYVCGAWLAASGIAAIGRPRVAFGVAVVMAAVIVVAQGARCLDFNRRFADDSRQRLRAWMAANVPPNAAIVADWFAGLNDGGDPWRFPDQPRRRLNVRGYGYASNAAGSLDGLADNGVRYVVAVRPSFSRFFAPGVGPIAGDGAGLERTRRFYRELFDRGRLVWSNLPDPPANGYVDPEIRVYDITALTPSKEPPPPPRPPTAAERYFAEMARRRAAASRPAP